MAREIRIEYPGAIYHVMNRGDRRAAIFHDERDRERFCDPLGEACEKAGWQVQASFTQICEYVGPLYTCLTDMGKRL